VCERDSGFRLDRHFRRATGTGGLAVLIRGGSWLAILLVTIPIDAIGEFLNMRTLIKKIINNKKNKNKK
jgi:hypothetical protein